MDSLISFQLSFYKEKYSPKSVSAFVQTRKFLKQCQICQSLALNLFMLLFVDIMYIVLVGLLKKMSC